jgi:hypothetical protein
MFFHGPWIIITLINFVNIIVFKVNLVCSLPVVLDDKREDRENPPSPPFSKGGCGGISHGSRVTESHGD